MLIIPSISVKIADDDLKCDTCFNRIPKEYGYVIQYHHVVDYDKEHDTSFDANADYTEISNHHVDCFIPQISDYMGQVIAWKKDLERIASKGPPYSPTH